ncbi:MAG: 50S ribosome-binding GTPase, partial [Microlunatus sp.]|nr:50S ribosome-binding GTPase [Microlunatus sp.]
MRVVDRIRGRGGTGRVLERLDALEQAVNMGRDRLDPRAKAEAERVLGRTQERMRHGGENTVVALAGATGSGKSSLFNAVTGTQVARVGARRPTTSTPTGVVFDATADALLDWLEVGTRHNLGSDPDVDTGVADLTGLVLLDLPDHDSTAVAHQVKVDRMVGLVDLLVWVVDPQKYADDALHTRYLKKLVGHQGVMIVVLNHVDRLPVSEVANVLSDVKELLASEGLRDVRVLGTSAVTGQGVVELRQAIADAVSRHDVMLARVTADVGTAVEGLRGSVATSELAPQRLPGREQLVTAFSQAAGVPTVLKAVRADYLREAGGATGWPFTRWVRNLRPAPLRRVGLDRAAIGANKERKAIDAGLSRTSLPEPSRAQRAQVDLALRALSREAGEGLPDRWALAVREAADPGQANVADQLDRAIAGADLQSRRPLWWWLFGMLQLVLAVVAVLGLLWLTALFVAATWLQVPDIPTPRWRNLPYPTLMFVGGL